MLYSDVKALLEQVDKVKLVHYTGESDLRIALKKLILRDKLHLVLNKTR